MRKYKVVQACYYLVNKVNFNLVAALSQGCTTLLPHCNNLGIETVTQTVTTLLQGYYKVVAKRKIELHIWHMAKVWWVLSSEMGHLDIII